MDHLVGRVDELGIAAVVLHRHIKKEHRLALGLVLVQVDQLGKVGFVADTVAGVAADHARVVKRGQVVKMLKAEQRIDFFAVPAIAVKRMDGVGGVTLRLQHSRQRGQAAVNVLLVDNAAGGEKA